jgi:hypothetical protein
VTSADRRAKIKNHVPHHTDEDGGATANSMGTGAPCYLVGAARTRPSGAGPQDERQVLVRL